MEFSITKKQGMFLEANADEVLFGGAAGGGKSYAQLIDAFQYAVRYQGSKQLMLRRTFPELVRSILQVSYSLFPQSIASYHKTEHQWRFYNGSTIEFGYCDSEGDVVKYQSAEYDVIRFDELTHFSEFQYLYLLSRNRGANDFPKQIKSTTNPGGIGHSWVKRRFIDSTMPNKVLVDTQGRSRIFIPAKVTENHFLMGKDPSYIKRLASLPTRERLALLEGCWDLFDGQYFDNFRRECHVVPYCGPQGGERIYCGFDYGLDMFACLFIAVDASGDFRVFAELYQSGLLASVAAQRMKEMVQRFPVEQIFTPSDLWGTSAQTGRSIASMFQDVGLSLTKVSSSREAGWMMVKEALEPTVNGKPSLTICDNCLNLIRTLPALLRDSSNPNDTAKHPHELTHAPDALRYILMGIPTAQLTTEPSWQENLFERRLEWNSL